MTQQPGRILGAALGLVLITGLVHFVVGLFEIGGALRGDGALGYGPLFVVGGVLAVGLVGSFYTEILTPIYTSVAGFGLMVLFLIAYADVHAIGTLESLTGAELHAHDHSHDNGHDHNGHDDHSHDNGHDHNGHDGDSTAQIVIDHLRDDLFALGMKLTELSAAVLFAVAAFINRE